MKMDCPYNEEECGKICSETNILELKPSKKAGGSHFCQASCEGLVPKPQEFQSVEWTPD
jgi:hypothetical protein